MKKYALLLLVLTLTAGLQAQSLVNHYVKASLNATLRLAWTPDNYGTIQWQSSADQGQTWTDISGANSAEYTVKAPARGAVYYRVVVNGDEACEPFVQTHVLNVVSFNVNLAETYATSAVFTVSGLDIPASEVVEYGVCYNYSGLNRTYTSMQRQAIGKQLPEGDSFEVTCEGLLPSKSYSLRLYFKTKDGSLVYGPGKLVQTLAGLEWTTEDWTITKNAVRARFQLSGYFGATPTMKFEFGQPGNMKTYTTSAVTGKTMVWQSASITGLQPATDYIARVTATVDGEEQVIEKTVRTWTDYSTYEVDNTVKPVKHRIRWGTRRTQLNPDNMKAEYPRLLRLNDNELLLAYHGGDGASTNDYWQNIYLQRSYNNGVTWTAPEKYMDKSRTFTTNNWYRFCNPELVKLQNGWVVMSFIGNANPETNDNCQVFVTISKDGGYTWGDPITVMRGRCWEPMIVQLPGGELELLVSSEAAWWQKNNGDNQEIRCARSTDNGQTWTSSIRACYFPGQRDGMPVVVNMQGNQGLLFSIETPTSNINPSLVHRSLVQEWETGEWDGVQDDRRWINTNLQGGCAPYMIQLPTGEIVMCAHQNQNGDVWQTCRSSVSIGDSSGHNFTARTLPFSSLPRGEGAYYCQLFLKDPTHIWLIITHSTYNGTTNTKNVIEYIEGTITER